MTTLQKHSTILLSGYFGITLSTNCNSLKSAARIFRQARKKWERRDLISNLHEDKGFTQIFEIMLIKMIQIKS